MELKKRMGQWDSGKCSAEPEFTKGYRQKGLLSAKSLVHCVNHQNRKSEANKQDEGQSYRTELQPRQDVENQCILNYQGPRLHQVTLEWVKGLNTNVKHPKSQASKIKGGEASCLSCFERRAKRSRIRKSLRKYRRSWKRHSTSDRTCVSSFRKVAMA